jgi:hypothetical protein
MKNKNLFISIFVFIIIGTIVVFTLNKTLDKKQTRLDEVKLKEIVKQKNAMFAIMLEQSNGTYTESQSNTWPASGYIYNSTKSGCVDKDGNKVEGALDFNNNTKIATISGNSSLHCYLYFDILAIMELYVNQGSQDIDIGDEVSIQKSNSFDEHFYVVSSNSSETVLLAKYNLLVGNVYDRDGSTFTYNKTLSSSDSGYGLQSSLAKYDSNQSIGAVPFSGVNYWDNIDCEWVGISYNCNDTSSILKSEYATNGASYSGNPYPYVYNSSMSNSAPLLDYTNGYGLAQNNGYTTAYYVEQYIKSLSVNGTGRLLTYEEAQSLSLTNSSIVYNGTHYWLGSVKSRAQSWYVSASEKIASSNHGYSLNVNLRPVIVVSTDDIILN